MLPIRKILCPTDFSEPSYAALQTAAELAAHFGATLCLLHVTPTMPPAPTDLLVVSTNSEYYEHSMQADAAQRLQTMVRSRVPGDVQAYPLVRSGDAATQIVQAADDEHADMLVISTHGLTGWRHLVFGSVAETVVRLARCPVLTTHNARYCAECTPPHPNRNSNNGAVKETV